jgi:flagellar biosynthesis protein FlhF
LNDQDYKEAADREYLKAREIVDLVKQELSAMRDEFKMSQHKDSWTGKLAVNEEMGPLIESLNETGMPLGMRESVIEVINQSASMGDAIAQLTAAIGDEIEHIDLINNLQGVHVIAGSFGAGKTLMAGRLAKQMAQQYGEDQVALISFNDVRIGAWAQTQLIGSQAGVDTFRANSIDVLMQLTAELSDRKLTIIDTSGVDIERHINALNNALPDAQKHLVLASDASEASAKRLLKNDGPQWDSVMLSRFEAEVHPWAVIYLLLQHAVPLSLAAMNPNISDNAIPLNGLTLAEQALSQLPIHLV